MPRLGALPAAVAQLLNGPTHPREASMPHPSMRTRGKQDGVCARSSLFFLNFFFNF